MHNLDHLFVVDCEWRLSRRSNKKNLPIRITKERNETTMGNALGDSRRAEITRSCVDFASNVKSGGKLEKS